jgi:hypothetical protein
MRTKSVSASRTSPSSRYHRRPPVFPIPANGRAQKPEARPQLTHVTEFIVPAPAPEKRDRSNVDETSA